MLNVLDTVYYDNAIRVWMSAVLIFLVLFPAFAFIKAVAARKLTDVTAKTRSEWDGLIPILIKRIHFFALIIICLYAGTLVLTLPANIRFIINTMVSLVMLGQLAVLGVCAIRFGKNLYLNRHATINPGASTILNAVAFLAQVILWTIVLLLALANLGVNITALITGLGVGGIAVALAVQNILGDLFASFSIILDKPFIVDDFVIVDDYLGSIEKIGLKTTRIRSLSGEQLIFSNTDLLKSRIRNYKRMYERRVVFRLGVVYQTAYEQLAEIPVIIRNTIESQERVRFDRAHFFEYGAYALTFEVVYYVLSPDYNIYMDIQQAINLGIYRRFSEKDIEFAYPTQLLYMAKD